MTTDISISIETSNEPTTAMTSMSRGKYTFLIKPAFPTSESSEPVTALEKKIHGMSAHSR